MKSEDRLSGRLTAAVRAFRDAMAGRTPTDGVEDESGQSFAISFEDLTRYTATDRLMTALDLSQAVIEFEPDGTIIRANENFLKTTGYAASEIVGKHHRMFVDNATMNAAEYEAFWESLRAGEFQSAEFARVGKHGSEIWIRATYNPVFDEHGEVTRVVKFATDITRQKKAALEAINQTQATIEFKPDGTIVTANENFCTAMGYSLHEIRGQHHRMFCDPEWTQSASYGEFWAALGRGKFQQGEYMRLAKGGREVWIRAIYNPEFDAEGTVTGVVKYATDITAEVQARNATTSVAEFIALNIQEMEQALNEISINVSKNAQLSTQAREGASSTADIIQRLSDNSGAIDSVVALIRDLADQTNLLALNATIEAARAGEMGKGFAVVASEVKGLASDTADATASISESVKLIQRDIADAVEAIDAITSNVSEVDGSTTIVAAAVEEQSVLMKGLSSRASELLEDDGTPHD